MSTFRDDFWERVYIVSLRAALEHPYWFVGPTESDVANNPSEFAYNQAEIAVYNLDKSVSSGGLNMNTHKEISHGKEIK